MKCSLWIFMFDIISYITSCGPFMFNVSVICKGVTPWIERPKSYYVLVTKVLKH